MINQEQGLTERQINTFISFLLDGTDKAIVALENVFGLDIESSDSDIEIAPAAGSQFLQRLGAKKLYAVTSNMTGDFEGSITLLMRSSDFNYLGTAMKPILNLLFLSDPDSDLASLELEKPDWLQPDVNPTPQDEKYHSQMMDLLAEMGNVLIGMYIKAIYQIFHLTIDHTIPQAKEDPEQKLFSDIRFSPPTDAPNLVIENEFFINENPFKIWCLISPNHQSFQQLLNVTRH